MASLRDYYRRMAEENARLQEELRQARAEQGDSAENYKDISIPEPTGDLTVDDTLEMMNQLGVETDD